MINHFTNCFELNKTPATTFYDGWMAAKISEAIDKSIKKQRKIVVIDITNNTEIVCASIREASEVTGIGKPGICRECQGKAKTRGNFKFKYYE